MIRRKAVVRAIEEEHGPDFERRLSRWPEAAILAIAILIVSATGGLAYMNASQTSSRIVQLRATRDIQKLTSQLLILVTDAETSQRGFLLTGQEQYLKPYNRAVSAVPNVFGRLEARAGAAPDQAQRIRAIEPVIKARLAELKETMGLGRAKQIAAAVSLVNGGKGQALMDVIHARCAEITRVADQRTLEYNAASDRSALSLRLGSTIGSVLRLAW